MCPEHHKKYSYVYTVMRISRYIIYEFFLRENKGSKKGRVSRCLSTKPSGIKLATNITREDFDQITLDRNLQPT